MLKVHPWHIGKFMYLDEQNLKSTYNFKRNGYGALKDEKYTPALE